MSAPAFIPIGDVLVENSLWDIPFACDVKRCHGACCTVPGAEGAPLLEEEYTVLQMVLPVVLPRLTPQAQQLIAAEGAVMERDGQLYTRCVDQGPCVFVVWEGDIARCALEQAYEAGEIAFRKPLSCYLFPLRIRQHREQRYIVFAPFEECAPAYEHGRRCGTTVVQMVQEALQRAFGTEWYEELLRKSAER